MKLGAHEVPSSSSRKYSESFAAQLMRKAWSVVRWE